MAVGQNQWYHFGAGAPPILVYFSGDWDVHWGYGILTHGHIISEQLQLFRDKVGELLCVGEANTGHGTMMD